MGRLILDATPLIAIDRDSALLRAWLGEARERAAVPAVAAVTVAEVWRGGRRSARLGQLFKVVDVVPVDEDLGRRAGELLAACDKSDAVDALVVALAERLRGDVLTGDPDDIGPLADRANVKMLEFQH